MLDARSYLASLHPSLHSRPYRATEQARRRRATTGSRGAAVTEQADRRRGDRRRLTASDLPDLTALADRYPDERDLLPALAEAIAHGEAWLAEARQVRDYAALRLRYKGMTSRSIAVLAGVTDSYLARKAIGKGAARRRVLPTVAGDSGAVGPV